MSGKEPGDRNKRTILHRDLYRPIGENGLPAPKSEAELAADRAAVSEWRALMAASPYSGFR